MEDRVLAIIIDGEVVSLLHFDAHTASMLLSNPEIVDVTEVSVSAGWEYDPNSSTFHRMVDGQRVDLTTNPGTV